MKRQASPFLLTPRTLSVALLALIALTRGFQPGQAADGDAKAPPIPENATRANFDEDVVDTEPDGFLPGRPGSGGAAVWKIVASGDAPSGRQALGQLSEVKLRKRRPHIVHNNFVAADVDVSVKFKTVVGGFAQSAGVMFRYRDSKNYYVVRADASENNVVAFKCEDGRMDNLGVKGKETAYGVETRVFPRRWNSLRVIAKGPLMEVWFNDAKLFEVEDDTFLEAGRAGIWTEADSVTHFDDFTAAEL